MFIGMAESDYQEASQQQWGDSADRWARAAEEEDTGASAEAAAWMLGVASPQPGARVLELACGAGRVSLQVASMVAPDGTVLCSDFAEAMVRAVDERITRLGMSSTAEARVLDAQQLVLEDEAFDLVLCRFGYMLMADPLQALRESARVLRPDGDLVFAVWGPGERNPWISTIFDAVMGRLNAPPPKPGTPGPFALADADRLREMIDSAGLGEVTVIEIEAQQIYESLEAWWENLNEISGPLAALLAALPEQDQEAIRATAISAAESFVADDGRAVFPASVIGAKAQKKV
jgi:SAM-dependent methyltransferase